MFTPEERRGYNRRYEESYVKFSRLVSPSDGILDENV